MLDRRARDRLTTPAEVAAELQRDLQSTRQAVDPRTGRQGAAVSFEPIEDDLMVGDAPAARFYAGFLSTANQPVIAGYTIALTEPGRFLILQLEAPAQQASRATDLYERMLASVQLRNPVDVAAQRAAAVRAGSAFLASLPASEYLAALPREPVRWTRTVTQDANSPDGVREVSYQRIEMRTGKRGELNPGKPSSRWSPSEMEDGVLVKIEARAVAPPGSGLEYVDSQSISWMKLDPKGRGEESWSVRMVLRERGRDSVYSEVGARLGDQLVVTINSPGAQPAEKSWRIPPEGYISQVETHLLRAFFPRRGADGHGVLRVLVVAERDQTADRALTRLDAMGAEAGSLPSTRCGAWRARSPRGAAGALPDRGRRGAARQHARRHAWRLNTRGDPRDLAAQGLPTDSHATTVMTARACEHAVQPAVRRLRGPARPGAARP